MINEKANINDEIMQALKVQRALDSQIRG